MHSMRSTTPPPLDKYQQFVAENITIVLEYLTALTEHIDLPFLLDNEEKGERLFFKPKSNCYEIDLTSLDAFFKSDLLYERFNELVREWVPTITVENILNTRQKLREYFFLPFKKHSAFITFLKARITIDRYDDLIDTLAGCFVYRICMSWLPKRLENLINQGASETTISEEKQTIHMLSRLMNNGDLPSNIIAREENALNKQINDELELIFKKINTDESTLDEINQRILNIRKTVAFKALDNSLVMLSGALYHAFCLIDPMHEAEKKKIAPLLFAYLEEEFTHDGKINASDLRVRNLLESIEMWLDSNTTLLCKHALGQVIDDEQLAHAQESRRKVSLSKREAYGKGCDGFFSKSRKKLNTEEITHTAPSATSPRTDEREKHDRRVLMRKQNSRTDVRTVFQHRPGSSD